MCANPLTHMDVDTLPDGTSGGSANVVSASSGGMKPNVSRYDFKKPKHAAQGYLHNIHTLHTGFAHELADGLSALVRNRVEVRLLGTDQISLREFFARLDNPTCLSVLSMEALSTAWMVDIQPVVLYPIIDCMLGGGQQSGPLITRRPPTDIELRLASHIGDLLCEELRRAWAPVADFRLKLQRIESNPRAMQMACVDDTAVMVRFGVSLGYRKGLMRLCIPGQVLEPYNDRIFKEPKPAEPKPQSLEAIERIGREVVHSRTEIKAWLAETKITMHDLFGLRVGDIITTQKNVNTPVVVTVAGVPKFHARPGAVRGRKAIVIMEPIAEETKPAQESNADNGASEAKSPNTNSN
jgi:flagellar motor switch protein FliM